MTARLNACELEIALLCSGVRIDPECSLGPGPRFPANTRAGLGSGLELIIPGDLKDVWVNVPVEEDFVVDSPYLLSMNSDGYLIRDTGSGNEYPVGLEPEPQWYTKRTARGVPMSEIGVLQGTFLGVYVSNSCSFWHHSPSMGCKFCTTGVNVGVNESTEKDLRDVVDVALTAKRDSGISFVHFNSGHTARDRGLDIAAPYITAMKEEVGLLTGLQVTPSPNLWKYDWLRDCGVDHFSFCYEFQNPRYFAEICPGKEKFLGQRSFFNALEYTARLMGPGRVSGEIIAGVEPLEDTLEAIDYITGLGAFPIVCIFRPTLGSEMERESSPSYEDMRMVMEYMWDACRRNNIPVGAAPGIEASQVVTPEDARMLPKRDYRWKAYELKLQAMRRWGRIKLREEFSPHRIKGDPHMYPVDAPQPVSPMTEEAVQLAHKLGVPSQAP